MTLLVFTGDPLFGPILLGFLALVIYFLPTVIAQSRQHQNFAAIAVTNFLLGWTGIGWCVALIWASTSNVKKPKPSSA